MELFDTCQASGHEQVVFCHNGDVGLRAIIAIHNTALGPALGGLRIWPYDTEDAALDDVLRLSQGMSYKNAMAGLKFGGGKVIRDGMGQSQAVSAETMDLVITNALIVDHWGIVKADVGIKNGRIAAIGKATSIPGSKTCSLVDESRPR